MLALLPLAGCKFADLGDELEEMERFSVLEGQVTAAGADGNPVAVALFAEALARDHLFDAQLLEARSFRFGAPPGRYFLFAFEDRNRDFRYQPEEAAGFYGAPTAVLLGEGEERDDLRITLRQGLLLPKAGRADSGPPGSGRAQFPKLWAGRKNIGAVTTLADPRFEMAKATMGLWQPLRYTLDIGPGVFFLEPYEPEKIPVLFVHGIEGSPRIWGEVIARLDRTRFQPWVFSYASGLPLDATARYLYNAVTQLRLLHGFESLYLVAHSMGGLVSQAFVERSRAADDDYLKLFVTVSTPWAGHSAAQLGVDYAPAVVPVWRDMAPESVFLADQRENQLPAGLPFHLLFSYGGGGLSSEANDGSVTLASQLAPSAQARATKLYGFDKGHVEILADEAAIDLLMALIERAEGEGEVE